MMKLSRLTKLGIVAGIGAVLTVVGGIMVHYWPSIYNNLLIKELQLTKGSLGFRYFEEMPVDINMNFYFFNCTNTEEVLANHSKPHLVELGPYVFRESRKKVKMQINANNDTITYQQLRKWNFQRQMSDGSLNDPITTLNIPALYAASAVRDYNFGYRSLVNSSIAAFHEELFVTKPVNELLFDGYFDALLNLSHQIHLPFIRYPFDKFGWFYPRNNTDFYDGVFNIYTGSDDIMNLGKIHTWNYSIHTNFYQSYCAKVNGSAGEFWPPNQNKTRLTTYNSDICRSINLPYKDEKEISGITGYRYWGSKYMFTNKTTCEDSWCFCSSNSCIPDGVLNVTECRYGAPVYMSLPHFYMADPYYRKAVVGMKPEPEKHTLYIILEPNTGIPLSAQLPIQINVLLQPVANISLYENVPTIYFPILWLSEEVEVNDDLLSKVNLMLTLPDVGCIIFYVLFGLGVAMLLVDIEVAIVMYCRRNAEN